MTKKEFEDYCEKIRYRYDLNGVAQGRHWVKKEVLDAFWADIEQAIAEARIDELNRLRNTGTPIDAFDLTFENRIKELEKGLEL